MIVDAIWPLIRRFLFRMDAEHAHDFTLRTIASAPRLWGAVARGLLGSPPSTLACTVAGLKLASPIGLAAGLDKNGVGIPFWPALGFGFIEIGTVTAHPQPGNPAPRMFRLVEDAALINRMGFNNHGADELSRRLTILRERGQWPTVPVGVNLGKSKVTPIENAISDYAFSAKRMKGLADYLTVNVSSPNTPGLRSLQDRALLEPLLPAVIAEAGGIPVFVKLAPDLTDEAIVDAVNLAVECGISGIIATNTTIGRVGLSTDPGEPGGLSGRPLWPLAHKKILTTLAAADKRVPVIGVGGIESADQVRQLMDAGCAAVQLYSSFIFQGPGLIARLHRDLEKK